jgi:hypothetical protein
MKTSGWGVVVRDVEVRLVSMDQEKHGWELARHVSVAEGVA